MGSILGQGTKIPDATWCNQKKKRSLATFYKLPPHLEPAMSLRISKGRMIITQTILLILQMSYPPWSLCFKAELILPFPPTLRTLFLTQCGTCHRPALLVYDICLHHNTPFGPERVFACAHSIVSDSLPPKDGSLPGPSVYVIFQSRILEKATIAYSRGSFWPEHTESVNLCLT